MILGKEGPSLKLLIIVKILLSLGTDIDDKSSLISFVRSSFEEQLIPKSFVIEMFTLSSNG